jgi:hypothetical protein
MSREVERSREKLREVERSHSTLRETIERCRSIFTPNIRTPSLIELSSSADFESENQLKVVD